MTRRTKVLLGVGGAVVVLAAAFFGLFAVVRSGVTRPFDNRFGDQHLKTVVALVELHRVRFGRYPHRLADLHYTGEWDQLALNAVAYCANVDGTRYFVEVRRSWLGRPELTMPEGFWQGIGFDRSVGPCL